MAKKPNQATAKALKARPDLLARLRNGKPSASTIAAAKERLKLIRKKFRKKFPHRISIRIDSADNLQLLVAASIARKKKSEIIREALREKTLEIYNAYKEGR